MQANQESVMATNSESSFEADGDSVTTPKAQVIQTRFFIG